MNILYICPRFPYPVDQGNKMVIYNQIKYLSKRNTVTLLAMEERAGTSRDFGDLYAYCSKIEIFRRRPNFSIGNFIVSCCKTDPFTVIRYHSGEMFRRSKELIESRRFDIVHVAYYYMAQYAVGKGIKIPETTAAILDAHIVESLFYSQYAGLSRNPAAKFFLALEAFRIKRYEPAAYRKFDKCVMISDRDRRNIEKIYNGPNLAVNPACVELRADDNASPVCEEENTMLFFGGLKYFPNDDAIRFFYEKIFPEIKNKIPAAKFLIAGGNPSPYVRGLSRDPNVRLLGFVPDMRVLLKKTALVIAPIRIGGGIRIKILDAWSMGKAVVSTSIGAEGVDVADGKDIIIADSANDFAKAVTGLLEDKNKRALIGQAALGKVRDRYNPERVVADLEKIYAAALEEKGGKKLKVLHISQSTGGVQRHVVSILERMNRDRFEISAICPPAAPVKGVSADKESFARALSRIGVRVYLVEMIREINLISDTRAFFKIYNFMKKERFDIVHTHSSKAGFLGRIAARLAGIKAVVHTPNSFAFDRPEPMLLERKFYAFLERFAGLFCDKIIAVCEGEKRLAEGCLGLPQGKVEVIYNAIDASLYNVKVDAAMKKKELGIKETDRVVILVGRMARQKAPLDFINAAKEAEKDFHDVKFLLLGDGPFLDAAKKYTNKNGISDFVKILGWRNDAGELTALSDIFAISSLWEALPYSVLDAMALGKPIVTTDTLFAGEFVIDDYNGFVVPKGKPVLLARAISKLLKLNGAELSEFGKHSREILAKRPGLDETVKATEDLYKRLLNEQ